MLSRLKWIVPFLIGASHAVSAPAGPKLAVLATAEDYAPHADLLSVCLSTNASVVLIERDRIQQIWRDQELAATQQRDFVKLGGLLGADGLLLLERRIQDREEFLAARLLAVKPGVIVAEHRFSVPISQPADWAVSYAGRLAGLLPKLAVKPDEAIGLSLLNLRSSVTTPDGMALEQDLTALLQFRLAREATVFVLERRRMEELQTEKAIGVDSEWFWNGAYVLDGIINRDTVSRNQVTINAQLTPPGGTPVELAVAGRRDALGAVVDELTRKILASIRAPATAPVWQPEAEAERYFKEAEWAWQWKLWHNSAEAADASWALGRRTFEVADMRIRSRALMALARQGLKPWQGVGHFDFRPVPAEESLVWMRQAFGLYRDSYPAFITQTNGTSARCGALGLDLLNATSEIFEHYRADVDIRVGRESLLRDLREATRETYFELTRSQAQGLIDLHGPPAYDYFYANHFPRASIELALFSSHGSWFERPADALAEYERLLATNAYSYARGPLLVTPTPLTGWSLPDRLAVADKWLEFLRRMETSTNVLQRIDGHELVACSSLDPNEVERAYQRFLDEAWAERRAIFYSELDVRVPRVTTNVVRHIANWGRPDPQRIQSLGAEWTQNYDQAAEGLTAELWRELLAQAALPPPTNGGWTLFDRLHQIALNSPAPSAEQAQRTSATLDEWQRAGRSGTRVTLIRSALKHRAGDMLGRSNTASVIAPSATAMTNRQAARLFITRSWALADATPPAGRFFNFQPRARQISWHGGRLWMQSETYRSLTDARGMKTVLIALDPTTMQAEVVEPPFSDYLSEPRRAMITDDGVFFAAADAIWHRDSAGQWHRLPAPIPRCGALYPWRNTVVLNAGDSLLQIDPKASEAVVLASSRRNPPANELDRAGVSVLTQIAVWPGETLCAETGGTVWEFNPTNKQWFKVFTATNCGEDLELFNAGAIYRQSTACGPGLLGVWHDAPRQLEPLACGVVAPLRPSANRLFWDSYWLAPDARHVEKDAATFDGVNLCLFPKRWHKPGTYAGGGSAPASRSPSILYFDRQFSHPLELELEIRNLGDEHRAVLNAAPEQDYSPLEFLLTPAGLAILFEIDTVVLWVPRSEFQHALEQAARLQRETVCPVFTALQRFDRDGNRWLDAQERRAIDRDAHQSLTAAIKEASERHGNEWDAFFAEADVNKDGKLSRVEFHNARLKHPAFFKDRLRGVLGSVSQCMLPYDLDADFGLTLEEFHEFAADPRPLAEVNRSPDWVARFGLKPEVCDANQDGVLDDDEWRTTERRIREPVLKALRASPPQP